MSFLNKIKAFGSKAGSIFGKVKSGVKTAVGMAGRFIENLPAKIASINQFAGQVTALINQAAKLPAQVKPTVLAAINGVKSVVNNVKAEFTTAGGNSDVSGGSSAMAESEQNAPDATA